MNLPAPRPGLVICYSYLWADEYGRGREEGLKDRPCAIVAARQIVEGREVITVLPVTHRQPANPADGLEIPAPLKWHLGMDDKPSWIVLTETNDFLWPGPDLRPIPGSSPPRFAFGMLPPRFYAHMREALLRLNRQRRLIKVERSE